MAIDPLSPTESLFWSLRLKGLRLAEIGRRANVTRQAVYKALLKADRVMAEALRDVAGTYRIDLEKIDPKRGMAVGYSHALGSRVVLAYAPGRGILTWYEYKGQCRACARREECKAIVLEEAERLGVSIQGDLQTEPAELAEEVLRKAWPEAFQ